MSSLSKLFSYSGSYSLPWLIHLYGSNTSGSQTFDMRFINDSKSCIYNNNMYEAEAFSYTPAATEFGMSGGGTLEISCTSNQISSMVQLCTNITLEVVAVMLENGTITEMQKIVHKNGSVKGDRQKVIFTFERDERLDMSFPALIWNSQNNRGNT